MSDAAALVTGPGYDSPPTAEMVRGWLKVGTATITDDDLDLILAGELDSQAGVCRVEPWSVALTLAVFRRCGRAIAATGAPLGVVAGSEFGAATLPRWDAEIERYERPFRIQVLG